MASTRCTTPVAGSTSLKNFVLYHAATLTSERVLVGQIDNVREARIAYALDGDAHSAFLVAPAQTTPM